MARKKKTELRDQTVTEVEVVETETVPGPCPKCRGTKFMTEVKEKRLRVYCLSCPTVFSLELPEEQKPEAVPVPVPAEEILTPAPEAIAEEHGGIQFG